MFGALVYLLLRDIPYVDEAQARRNAEWYRTAPPASLNYQQVVRPAKGEAVELKDGAA